MVSVSQVQFQDMYSIYYEPAHKMSTPCYSHLEPAVWNRRAWLFICGCSQHFQNDDYGKYFFNTCMCFFVVALDASVMTVTRFEEKMLQREAVFCVTANNQNLPAQANLNWTIWCKTGWPVCHPSNKRVLWREQVWKTVAIFLKTKTW